MIDIHTHILPGLDDGAQDLEAALQMAQAAAADGIDRIIATPHVITGSFDYSREQILTAVNQLNAEITARQIPVQILPGGEYRLEADLPARLRAGNVLTLNDSRAYLLVELPSSLLPPDYERFIYDIQVQGIIPIIAHPERNKVIMKNPAILKKMTDRGIMAQLTTASVTGDFGKEIHKCARQLIEQGSVQFLASDAHTHEGHRSLNLSGARDTIKKDYGDVYAQVLVEENPSRLINGRDLRPQPPPTKPSLLTRLLNR